MNKRTLLGLGLLSLHNPLWCAELMKRFGSFSSIEDDGVTFEWKHQNGELNGILRAPTRGWIAVGFNRHEVMNGTHFVIASVADKNMLVEEHVATHSTHRSIEALGLPPTLTSAKGGYSKGYSCLSFTMTEIISGSPVLQLSGGSSVHVMLAWSRQPEFTHHSAWRKHYAITL